MKILENSVKMRILNNHILGMDVQNMKTVLCSLILFFSTVAIQAMDNDAMEIDNGSPLESSGCLSEPNRKGSYKAQQALFRAINICSPITVSKGLDSEIDNAVQHKSEPARENEKQPSNSPCDEFDREIDQIQSDLSDLAINPDAMDDN